MLMEALGIRPTESPAANASIGAVADPINLLLAAALVRNRVHAKGGREAVGRATEATLHSMRPKAIEGTVRAVDLGDLSDSPVEEAISQALRYASHASIKVPIDDYPSEGLIERLAYQAKVRPEVRMTMDAVRKLAKKGVPIEDFVWGPSRGFARPAPILPGFEDAQTLRREWDRIASRRHDLFDAVDSVTPEAVDTNQFLAYGSLPHKRQMVLPASGKLDIHAMLHEAAHIADGKPSIMYEGGNSANRIYRAEFPAIFEELQSRLLEKRFEEAIARNALQSLNRWGLGMGGVMGAYNSPAAVIHAADALEGE